MAAPLTQFITVPDVGAGAGPWPSASWTAATFPEILRLGLAANTNPADLIVLLGSATGTDPILPTTSTSNLNHLGTFLGGAGSQNPDVQNIQACAYYAFLRYPAPKGTSNPTTGAVFEITGTVGGATGPAGPAGPAGATGPAGPTGPTGPAGTGSARPASDANTLLDFRFNETAVGGVLVNHGSYGTGTSPLGPAPTTTTANFTQPVAGQTVVVSVPSSTGYQAGQLILVGPRVPNGGGGNYYYCTAVGAGTITLKNLGITGSTTPGNPVLSGSSLAVCLDLLYNSGGGSPALLAPGPYDYANSFGLFEYTSSGWCNSYNNGYLAGGCPDFIGITHASQHVLINRAWGSPNSTVPSNQNSQWFGYSWQQSWGPDFYTLGCSMQGNTIDSAWAAVGANQSFSLSGSGTIAGSGYADFNLWDLFSVTYDFTITSQAIKLYKNGYLVGTQDISATGSLNFGSTGYWYVGNPSYNGGDTGDRTVGSIAMCRYENVTRSPAYILNMYNTINPAAANWPVP